jgi:hypothetical protein
LAHLACLAQLAGDVDPDLTPPGRVVAQLPAQPSAGAPR